MQAQQVFARGTSSLRAWTTMGNAMLDPRGSWAAAGSPLDPPAVAGHPKATGATAAALSAAAAAVGMNEEDEARGAGGSAFLLRLAGYRRLVYHVSEPAPAAAAAAATAAGRSHVAMAAATACATSSGESGARGIRPPGGSCADGHGPGHDDAATPPCTPRTREDHGGPEGEEEGGGRSSTSSSSNGYGGDGGGGGSDVASLLLRATYTAPGVSPAPPAGYLVLGRIGGEQHCKPQTHLFLAAPLLPQGDGRTPDPRPEARVAIKVIHQSWARRHEAFAAAAVAAAAGDDEEEEEDDDGGAFDFPLGEQAALAMLAESRLGGSPHVLPLLESMEDSDYLYLVFPYADGGELFEAVHDNPKGLPEATARDYLVQVGRGLLHLKRHGMAHGDVSLENVMLSYGSGHDRRPVLSLIDLEMARLTTPPAAAAAASFYDEAKDAEDDEGTVVLSYHGDTGGRRCRRRGIVGGKPNYAPPECIDGAVRDWHAADVWSLGISLYMMLTGRPLYRGPEDVAFDLLASGGAPGLLHYYATEYGLRLPGDSASLVAWMLKADPRERPTLEQVLAHPWVTAAAAAAGPLWQPQPTVPMIDIEEEEEEAAGLGTCPCCYRPCLSTPSSFEEEQEEDRPLGLCIACEEDDEEVVAGHEEEEEETRIWGTSLDSSFSPPAAAVTAAAAAAAAAKQHQHQQFYQPPALPASSGQPQRQRQEEVGGMALNPSSFSSSVSSLSSAGWAF